MTVRRVVVDHVLFVVRDLQASRRFYEAALRPLGFTVLSESETCVAFGVNGIDDFAICVGDEAPTSKAHVAFIAESRNAVDEFFEAALANGGREKDPPAAHPEYHSAYYGAFVWDPEGNNVEAVHHGPREWPTR
jgi:catechol 2,3-dioxygenase-like lactoylglutathione lyase family enzyme